MYFGMPCFLKRYALQADNHYSCQRSGREYENCRPQQYSGLWVCAVDQSQDKEANRRFHQEGSNAVLHLSKSRVHCDFGYVRENIFNVSPEAILDLESVENRSVN